MTQTSARGISFAFDPAIGLLDGFTVLDQGRTITPLHRAPWVGTDEGMPPDAAPHLARLGGDFFCAPFAGTEAGSPLHGWPANAPWTIIAHSGGTLRALLSRPVHGATLIKEVSVTDEHPFVYQRHIFIGGQGEVAVANHANLSLPQGGLIRTSAKLRWQTPASPQESDPSRGRSALRYPAQSSDPRAFPSLTGTCDLTRYPWNPRHEDFVAGIEAPGSWFGWTAVTRPAQGDLYLSLRNAHALPLTMLWHSNGGRDYAPWSGRHVACLGIEEGATPVLGPGAPIAPDALTLSPHGVGEVRHIIGAIAWPSGEAIARIVPGAGSIDLHGEGGAFRRVPCHLDLLRPAQAEPANRLPL